MAEPTSPENLETPTELPAETPPRAAIEAQDSPDAQRVSKLISQAKIASRRAAETMISEGRVSINGHIVREQGIKADPEVDRIVVDGHPLQISSAPKTVVVFHKPRNVMTTRDDPGNRPTVFDLLPKKFARFHSVGRLDFDTSGLLLLTDDGELTHLLTHPSHGAEKTYQARVRGKVETADLLRLRRGPTLDDGPTLPCRAKIVAQREKNALVELTLREGRNRQVRRMLEAVGHPVSALRRTEFAGIELEGLAPGEFRVLLAGEVTALRKRAERKSRAPGAAKPRKIGWAKASPKPNAKPRTPFKPRKPEKAALAKVAERVAREWKD